MLTVRVCITTAEGAVEPRRLKVKFDAFYPGEPATFHDCGEPAYLEGLEVIDGLNEGDMVDDEILEAAVIVAASEKAAQEAEADRYEAYRTDLYPAEY